MLYAAVAMCAIANAQRTRELADRAQAKLDSERSGP
jgi:hypothetical protein